VNEHVVICHIIAEEGKSEYHCIEGTKNVVMRGGLAIFYILI
jgi:hypothetical protein